MRVVVAPEVPLRPLTLPLALAVAGGALGLISAALILQSDHVAWAPVAVVAALSCGWGYIACGLLFDRGRGMSRFGGLMVAEGFAWLTEILRAAPKDARANAALADHFERAGQPRRAALHRVAAGPPPG